jgi:ABC-type molybdate transport system substrate-binding protein
MSNRNRFTVATISWSSALVFAFAAQGGAAIAAEVKVFSTFATRAIMEDLVPKFEKASGHKVTSSIANTGGILKRIQDGDISDRNCFCWGLALPIYYGIGPAQESHNRAQ